jgi:Holliday junction resolvase RusA-like endonuclease
VKNSGLPLSSFPPHVQAQISAQIHPQSLVAPLPVPVKQNQIGTAFIEPMGKPRMTQRDKWFKRKSVTRYWSYAAKLRSEFPNPIVDPVEVSWKAYFSIPKSWSKKKRAEHAGKPHRSKPDRDNVDKGILDALWKDDSRIAKGRLEKFWDDGLGARIELFVEA